MTKKVTTIQNHDQAQALAFFLAKEKARHLKDVANIDKDLSKLKEKWGVEIPPVYSDVWIGVY